MFSTRNCKQISRPFARDIARKHANLHAKLQENYKKNAREIVHKFPRGFACEIARNFRGVLPPLRRVSVTLRLLQFQLLIVH